MPDGEVWGSSVIAERGAVAAADIQRCSLGSCFESRDCRRRLAKQIRKRYERE
jgi:hypothetical protein